jgi:SAM-dependent methyltransferase
MELGHLRRVWDQLGDEDPFWAVLGDARYKDGRWDRERFFALGDEQIGQILATAAEHRFEFGRHRALDFGCGVGRLTQALARAFDSAVGVDIAPSMIAQAQRVNQQGDRCRFVVNDHPDLRIFDDSSFDLVVSLLVLQHMAPKLSKGYISEFVRIVKPEGLIVFQIPAERTGHDEPAWKAVALPQDAYQAELNFIDAPASLRCRERVVVGILARNRSAHTWPASTNGLGLAVANHWSTADGAQVVQDDGRAFLPNDLPPGGSVAAHLTVTAPSEPGDYLLDVDMVHEGVTWFAHFGSPIVRLPVTVDSGRSPSIAADKETALPPPAAVMEMNTVSIAEITETVERAGGRIDWIDQRSIPCFNDCSYYIAKVR